MNEWLSLCSASPAHWRWVQSVRGRVSWWWRVPPSARDAHRVSPQHSALRSRGDFRDSCFTPVLHSVLLAVPKLFIG